MRALLWARGSSKQFVDLFLEEKKGSGFPLGMTFVAEIRAELGGEAISRACSMAWVYFCVKAPFGGLPSPLLGRSSF